MTTVNIYLNFNGNCEEAFNFYKSAFGGEFGHVGRFKDMPLNDGTPLSPQEGEQIMHISLPISRETVLMGSDTGAEWAAGFKQGNNFSISVNTDSKDDADRIFSRLSEGGQVTMPMSEAFWGSYFGMLIDRYGVQWMVSMEANKTAE